MVVLTRRIEGASRRSTIHARMDRAAYLIARTLEQSGPAGVNEMARSLSLDGSTVTRQIAAMEERGYVSRRPDPDDGRAWVIELTRSGSRQMASVRSARRSRFAKVVAGWQPDEIEQFGRLLERFNAGIADQVAATDAAATDH